MKWYGPWPTHYGPKGTVWPHVTATMTWTSNLIAHFYYYFVLLYFLFYLFLFLFIIYFLIASLENMGVFLSS